MPGSSAATGRAIALVVLLVITGIAVRGHLPGVSHSAPEQPGESPAAMIALITLVGAGIVIITIAIVATLRQPRTPRPSAQPLNNMFSRERNRPSLRLVLIVLGVILVWLIAVVLLVQLSSLLHFGNPSATSPSSAPPTPPAGATPTATPPPEPPPQQNQPDSFWFLMATAMFMLLLWVAGIVVAVVRNRRPPAPAPLTDDTAEHTPEPLPVPLAVAAERGLAEMGDLSREPREAIIACYAAMEDALATAPGAVPQDSDTPSEVLARAVENHAIHAGTATELVELFAEARFSPHVMNEDHRDIAVRALELVLAELRTAA